MKKVFALLTVFVLAFSLTVPTFAFTIGQTDYGERTAEMEEYYADGYKYATLIKEGTTPYFVMTTKPLEQNNVNGYVRATDSCGFVYWQYRGANNWEYKGKGTLADNQEIWSMRVYPSWATYEMTDNTGTKLSIPIDTDFFPEPPLAEVVLGVTEGELMTVTIPNLVGVLKTVVPYGVGCLALLAALKLFGKRSLIFRS